MLSSKTKQRIISTYAKYPNQEIELEARFGYNKDNRFISGVTRQVFNRIYDHFSAQAEPLIIKTTDYIGANNVRKSVISPTNNTDAEKTLWITKERLWNWTDYRYNVRYSMSRETVIMPVTDFQTKVIRHKQRYTFLVFGGSVKLDLTIVSQNSDGRDRTVYEVEIELAQYNQLAHFDQVLQLTLYRVLDTTILYTNDNAIEVINGVNDILDSTDYDRIGSYPLVQARNLKMKDMVWGGLLGNTTTGYSVTHKTDGIRKMLYFDRQGVWLIMAPHSINLIWNRPIPQLIGTVLDGELVPKDRRLSGAPDSKYWYLVFDCLAFAGDNSVQNKPHFVRMQYGQEVANLLKNNLITVSTKTFKNFGSPQEFFQVMRDMFRQQAVLSYEQDGFMFTPENTEYNPHSDKMPLRKRVLIDYPDVCKWKPKEKLTIDFAIKWKALPTGQRKIELYANIKGKNVLFRGSKAFPYQDQVESSHPLTYKLPSNTIVEYGWDYEKEILVPYLIRHDKNKPNRMDVANDVWADIHNPITEETLAGNTFTLLRKYHNKVKRGLFTDAANIKGRISLLEKDKKTLLDIGSGFGGDLTSWKNYKLIVAVEPNPEHIEELRRRIVTYGMSDKVRIVQAGGQDTQVISTAVREFLGGRADVISMMFSLTFFWQSSQLVDQLVDTWTKNIKPDGQIIFTTMDGDLVEQTFEPALNTGPAITKLELGPATLDYYGEEIPKRLVIDIKDTIVRDQTEWLVRLDDLKIRLSKYGFDIVKREKMDVERFLTQEEITMTQMYSYGVISRIADTGPLPEPQILVRPAPEIKTGLPILPTVGADLAILEAPVQAIESIPLLSQTLPVTIPPVSISDISTLTTQMEELEIDEEEEEEPEHELPGIPPDTYENVNVSWYPGEQVVRIGAIGDGSCFFHAVLNAYYPEYQDNADRRYRIDLVKKLRRDIAYTLQEPDPFYPGKIRWETAASGQLAALNKQQELGVDFTSVFGYPVDFSLNGLQRLFNSNEYLGNEVYQYAADMLNVDVYITRLTSTDLYVHQNTDRPGSNRRVVVISGNGNHYETIGLLRDQLFQTYFDRNDPFIVALRQQVSEEEYIPLTVDEEKLADGLRTLKDMGFDDDVINRELLIQHGLNIASVVNILASNN